MQKNIEEILYWHCHFILTANVRRKINHKDVQRLFIIFDQITDQLNSLIVPAQ